MRATPGGRKLTYEWAVHSEMGMGTSEPNTPPPPAFPEAVQKNGEAQAAFKMPAKGGVYRIYCYVRNDRGGAATGTLTLQVR